MTLLPKSAILPGMSPAILNALTIRRPLPEDRRAAWDLALAALPSELRGAVIAASAKVGPRSPAEVLAAFRGGQLVGAVWGEVQPGRAGHLYLPQLVDGETRDTGVALLESLGEWLAGENARFYQIQLDEVSSSDAALLKAAGAKYAGDLLYLASDLRAAPPRGLDLQFEPYDESQEDRLADLIARTYEGSLDVPILDGVRTTKEVLVGYRSIGAHRPEYWRFVRSAGEDVGCLLLTDHGGRQWELVYMGIVPHARGRGLGRIISAHAQRLVRDFGGAHLVLAVDAANAPAVVAYRRTGFERWRRSSVYLKVLCPLKCES
jgi:ribosomal protein S18 acetylase RimI-like enzyme